MYPWNQTGTQIFQDCIIEKAKAHLTDECRVLSQFTDKLKEEAAAQKWLPRWPDSHLTPIGCERSWEQGSLFTFCSFHPHFYLLCLIPATTSALILKRAKQSFKCKYQIVLFLWGCTEWSWRLGLMFYHRSGFSLEQNHSTAAPTAEQSIRGILVTFNRGVDQTQRLACCKAAALTEHPAMMDSWLQTSISWLSFKFIMLLSRFRCLHSGEASAVSFLRAHFFMGSSECAFPGTIFNRAPVWEAREWLSQQLHWQLSSKVLLIYLI